MHKLAVRESLDRKLKKLGKKDRELLKDPYRFKP